MELAGLRHCQCHPKGLLAPWPSGPPRGPDGWCPASPPGWALSGLPHPALLTLLARGSFPGRPPEPRLPAPWQTRGAPRPACAPSLWPSLCAGSRRQGPLRPHWAPQAWLQALAPRGAQQPPGIPFTSRPWSSACALGRPSADQRGARATWMRGFISWSSCSSCFLLLCSCGPKAFRG